MAIHHAFSGELIDIQPFRQTLGTEITKALYKTNRLEVFRMVLLAGKEMPTHSVAGEVTIQCLEGSIELVLETSRRSMREGHLICLAGKEIHALKAIEDSSVLVTILLHGA